MKLFLFLILVFTGFSLSSFRNNKNHLQISVIDTSSGIATMHAKLGKSIYFIDKPVNCVENVLMEQSHERVFQIYPRGFLDNSKSVEDGFSSFSFDKMYISRRNAHEGELFFNDVFLGKEVKVQEYYALNTYYRNADFVANGEYIHVECEGISKESLEKYYNVLKSLSTK